MAKFSVRGPASETFKAKAIAAVAKGDPLKFTTGGVTVAGDGDTVDAFASAAASINTYVTCVRGDFSVIGTAFTGVNFAIGDQVYLTAAGTLDAGTTGNKSMGVVIGDDPEQSGYVEFRFDPLATFEHA